MYALQAPVGAQQMAQLFEGLIAELSMAAPDAPLHPAARGHDEIEGQRWSAARGRRTRDGGGRRSGDRGGSDTRGEGDD
jgi:hypothetical protein